MTTIFRAILTGLCIALMASALLAQGQMPTTTKEEIPGASSVTTQQLHGTVVQVEGNSLVVRMSDGGIREFDVPESRQFIIDGKTLSVHDLVPGTRLNATVTTTTTPVTERTTTVGTGKVWFVSGNTVILTLPNNENRMYKVKEDYRFIVNGQKASVHDLRKGMVISAEKIVEAPKTVIASNVAVTGHAPVAKAAPVQTAAATPTPAAPQAAPAAPAPAPAEQAAATPSTKLPKTGSPLPLIGLLGLAFTSASFGLRRLRRS
jgi:LPXTG-motif cell wall-anchored protein